MKKKKFHVFIQQKIGGFENKRKWLTVKVLNSKLVCCCDQGRNELKPSLKCDSVTEEVRMRKGIAGEQRRAK